MPEYYSNTCPQYNKGSLLFKLLRIGLGIDAVEDIHISGDWSIDIQFVIGQGVSAFIYDGLRIAIEKKTIPPDAVVRNVKMSLFANALQIEEAHQHHTRIISKLAEFYAEYGIKMMVLKGYGLSLLYPHPNHRPCGDIDIWLFGEQERADKLLHEKKGVGIDYGHQHHTVFFVDGVMIENHFEFVNVISHLSNNDIEQELHKIIDKEQFIPDNNINNVYYPSANFNALFLLRHTAAHFASSEIALRHVTDWAMFVKHHHKEIDWDWLYDFAKKQNMHRFLHCLNAICVDYIGFPLNIFPNLARDKELEARVMMDILQPAYPERSDLRKCWWKNYAYTLRRWWGNRWKHRIVYREGLLVSFLVLLTSHYRTR